MPGALAQTSVLLLARARLAQMAQALRAKLARPGARITDLDHRVLFLAEKALAMLSDGPPPSDLTPPHPLAQGISKLAVLGSAGPNIPAAAAVLADGHEWVYRTLHKGTPDEDRERVVARSTDFVLAFVHQATTAIAGLPAGEQPAAQSAMRAYALGHLCHVAADVVSGPWIDDLEDHLGLRGQPGFPFGARGPIDSRVALQVLGAPGLREGQNWKSWWPTPDEVPSFVYDAFRQAFTEVYGAARTHGSAEFEQRFAHLDPPALSTDFVRDGYGFYYHGVLGMGYGFGYWNWALLFVPLVVNFALELVFFPLLPHAQKAFAKAPWDLPDPDGERAVFELFAFPLVLAAPSALVYGFSAAALTHRGVGGADRLRHPLGLRPPRRPDRLSRYPGHAEPKTLARPALVPPLRPAARRAARLLHPLARPARPAGRRPPPLGRAAVPRHPGLRRPLFHPLPAARRGRRQARLRNRRPDR